jgi:SAM-dependent methyltransferase
LSNAFVDTAKGHGKEMSIGGQWRSFALSYVRARLEAASCHLAAVRDSIGLHPGEFRDAQFIRLYSYMVVKEYLNSRKYGDSTHAAEFGGSNGFIKAMLSGVQYDVAPNFPDVDIQNLRAYAAQSYDIVVVDNILEHVADPQKAVAEILRILRQDGICICLTPFLIKIHGYPNDYWRFTGTGLRKLFENFGEVKIWSWGNQFTIRTTMQLGWLSTRNSKRLLKAALWNEEEWPITYLTIARKIKMQDLMNAGSV